VPARKSQKRSLTQKAVSSPPQWMATAAWVKLSYSLHLHCQLQLSECCCSLTHDLHFTLHWTSVTMTRWSSGTRQNSSMIAFQASYYTEMLRLSHCFREEVYGRWNELPASREATSFFHIVVSHPGDKFS
jgi:hypothetical protein